MSFSKLTVVVQTSQFVSLTSQSFSAEALLCVIVKSDLIRLPISHCGRDGTEYQNSRENRF